MDLKKKKVIAREFLLFLICIIIALVTYGGIHSYNFIKKKKNAKRSHQLKTKQAELDSLKEATNVRVDEFGIPIREYPFKEFGGQRTLPPPPPKNGTPRHEQYKKISRLQKGVNTIWFKNKEESKTILTCGQINQTTLNAFIICMALIFGLRYLWYAINWSIKTIKS